MGIGHKNTINEQETICLALQTILRTLDNKNCEFFSGAEWWTGTETCKPTSEKQTQNQNAIEPGKKTRTQPPQPSFPGILKLLHEVNVKVRKTFRSNNQMQRAEWISLLKAHPDYAECCDAERMRQFSARNWLELIPIDSDRFITLCRKHRGFEKFYSKDMADLLLDFPELADKCLLYRMSAEDWRRLAERHPILLAQYTRKQKRSEKSQFDIKHFIEVVKAVPHEAWKYIDWKQFSQEAGCCDWKSIIYEIPEARAMFGIIALPDDLLDTIQFLAQRGVSSSSKYDWINWRKGMNQLQFTQREMTYAETEFFVSLSQLCDSFRLDGHNNLLKNKFPELYDRLFMFFQLNKFPSRMIELLKKNYKTCPCIKEFCWVMYISKYEWEALLALDYDAFSEQCWQLFPTWFRESDMPSFDAFIMGNSFENWKKCALEYFSDSLLKQKDYQRLLKYLRFYWEENTKRKKRKKANAAKRAKLPLC